MTPTILDGKKLADSICTNLKERVEVLKSKGVNPKLIVISTGNDPASKIYMRNKQKRCEEIGIDFEHWTCDKLDFVTMHKARNQNCPVIVQMPFESDEFELHDLNRFISAENDVDGFVSIDNVASLAEGRTPKNYPCTPLGIMKLLNEYDIELKGKNALIIGRSNIVGRPLGRMMEHKGANVTICHSKTDRKDLYRYFLNADIIVSATGHQNTLSIKDLNYYNCNLYDGFDYNRGKAQWKNKVIIDVGMNRNEQGKLCGDIDLEICNHCSAYTPVPGGVGPLTVAMLCNNVVERYENN